MSVRRKRGESLEVFEGGAVSVDEQLPTRTLALT